MVSLCSRESYGQSVQGGELWSVRAVGRAVVSLCGRESCGQSVR